MPIKLFWRWTKSGVPGCFLDKIERRCFHVREASGEAFARMSSRSVVCLDKTGHNNCSTV